MDWFTWAAVAKIAVLMFWAALMFGLGRSL